MTEDELTPELRLDLLFYGEAFQDSDGNRIDPRTVIICHCKQAPWLPTCEHKLIPLCPMAPYADE